MGIKAIIAGSVERIHRSNLVGMGILPLVFRTGETSDTPGLDDSETYSIMNITNIKPKQAIRVKTVKNNRLHCEFQTIGRLDNDIEVEYYKCGGILQYVLKQILRAGQG